MESSEDKFTALAAWWNRYKTEFINWWTKQTNEQRITALKSASPDIPLKSGGARSAENSIIMPTDLLLPEISLEAFLAADGKLLLLFISRRLEAVDLGFKGDLVLLNDQFRRGIMPSFSNNNFKDMDTPFIGNFHVITDTHIILL